MNKKILIIEDDEDIAGILQELLEEEGYHLKHAKNGKLALDYLQLASDIPNLIILDLMMPIMDGFHFRDLQLQDNKLKHIPVIVMTADGNITGKKERINAQEFIQKPFDLKVVLNIIKIYCN